MYDAVQAELDRIERNVSESYAAAAEKGAEIPKVQNSDNLPRTIASIPQEGTGGSILTEADAVEIAIATGLIEPAFVADDGSIYTDENGDVYIL